MMTMHPGMMEQMVKDKLKELPPIELSYETFSSHKKMLSSSSATTSSLSPSETETPPYQVGLFIPKSKKYIAWFTFIGENDVCILLELNREKQVIHHRIVHVVFDEDEPHLALGTFLYGSLVDAGGTFVIEDILLYKSVSLRKLCFGDRLGILHHILAVSRSLPHPDLDSDASSNDLRASCVGSPVAKQPGAPSGRSWAFDDKTLRSEALLPSCFSLRFMLPVMFSLDMESGNVAPTNTSRCGYGVHHIQHRSFTRIIPYLNFPPNIPSLSSLQTDVSCGKGPTLHSGSSLERFPQELLSRRPGLSTTVSKRLETTAPASTGVRKPTYKEPMGRERAVFVATADLQSDIYHLVHPSSWYMTDVAYIPNYKTSVMMNNLFRYIKENRNLDAMEESDDEADFADIRYDKYVNLTKQLTMECMYHKKFRRWIPLRVI